MKKLLLIGALVMGLSIVLVACASQATEQVEDQVPEQVQEQVPDPIVYTIDMSEYAFAPNSLTAQVGQEVTINLVNSGALEHEIMFGRDVMFTENGRPNGYEHDMFEEAGIEPEVMHMEDEMEEEHTEGDEHEEEDETHMGDHSGFMVVVPQGEDTARFTFTVTADMLGEWEVGCFLLDGVHYDSGMKGKFTVTN